MLAANSGFNIINVGNIIYSHFEPPIKLYPLPQGKLANTAWHKSYFISTYLNGCLHLSSFTVYSQQSTNFNIFYKEPFVDSERCNYYGKDGNTGPLYSCNQTGQVVAIRRWGTGRSVLSVCNITAYGG